MSRHKLNVYIRIYADYLRSKYKNMSAVPDPKWPPSIGKKITQLALIERDRDLLAEFVSGTPKHETMEKDYIHGKIDNIIARKKEIDFINVFDPVENDESIRILMDGAPGVGKTTLARKASIDWANGEFLLQYDLVVLVPLRVVKNKAIENFELESIFPADSPELKQQVIKHVQDTSGKGVLLIFDGFDELSDKERKENSFFLDIIQGDVLCQCSVLVTSRPYASTVLQQLHSIVRHVEVLGFTKKQIEACIRQNLPDDQQATDLIEKLKERVDIASLCYIPLNCAIMIYVYRRHCCKLPNTLTDLFDKFILDTLKRRALPDISEDCLSVLNTHDIPEPVKIPFMSLCQLAYEGMLENKFVYTSKELRSTFPKCVDTAGIQACFLDLVTSVLTITSSGEEMHYQFLHLSIQEFLCSIHIFNQLQKEEQVLFMQHHLSDVDSRFHLVLLFLAGMTKLETTSYQKFITHNNLNLVSKGVEAKSSFLFIAHMIFESQNLALYRLLHQSLADKTVFCLNRCSLSLFDCMLMTHFLCVCNKSWLKLSLVSCSLTTESLKVFKEICNSYENCNTSFTEVDLSENNPKLITDLSFLPAKWIKNTRKFSLHCSGTLQMVPKTPLSVEELSHIDTISMSTLVPRDSDVITKFTCKINPKATRVVLHGISTGEYSIHSRLDQKCLQSLNIAHVTVSGIADFVVGALSVDKPILRVLTLLDAGISCEDAKNLFHILRHNSSLLEFDLSDNPDLLNGDKGLGQAIKQVLTSNRTLLQLHLRGCVNKILLENITEGLLIRKNSLQTLTISDNTKSCIVSFMSTFLMLSLGKKAQRTLLVCHSKSCKDEPLEILVPQNVDLDNCTVQLPFHVPQSQDMFTLEIFNDESKNCTLCFKTSAVLVVQTIYHILCKNSLKVLKLHSSVLVEQTVTDNIATGLETNKSLQSLHIVGRDSILKKLNHALLNSSNANPSLCSLEICNIHLTRSYDSKVWDFVYNEHIDSGKLALLFTVLSQSKLILDICWSEMTNQKAIELLQLVCYYNCPIRSIELLNFNNDWLHHFFGKNSVIMVKVLSDTSVLRVLELTNCGITDTIAKSIAEGLQKNTTLESLYLNDNPVSINAMNKIFMSCYRSTNLLQLHLFDTKLSREDQSCLWTAHHSCSEEFLEVCKFESFKHVQLETLDFSQSKITSTSAVRILGMMCECQAQIHCLDLRDNPDIGQSKVQQISNLLTKLLTVTECLKDLMLCQCGIEDTVANGIAIGLKANNTLENITLNNNAISVGAMNNVILSADEKLNLLHLKLFDTQLTHNVSEQCWTVECTRSEEFLELCSLCSPCEFYVKVVDYSKTEMSSDRAATVVTFLSKCQATVMLDSLDLSCVPISVGLTEKTTQLMKQLLCIKSSLKELNLSNCRIDDTIARSIVAGLMVTTTLVKINLEGNQISYDYAQEMFLSAYSNPKLFHLQLLFGIMLCSGNFDAYSTFWIVPCSRFEKERLSLTACSICEDYLCNHPESLDFKQCEMNSDRTIRIFKWLYACRNSLTINTLDLFGNFDLGKQNIQELAEVLEKTLRSISLKTLNLCNCGIGDTVAKGIAAGLTQSNALENLYLNDNPASINAVNEVLLSANRNQRLLCLRILDTQLTRNVSEQRWIVTCTKSQEFLKLCSLCNGCNIQIETVNFSQTKMNSDGVATLVAFLLKCQATVKLGSLDVSHNPITEGVAEQTSKSIENLLCITTSPKALNLSNCGIDDTIARGIVAGLMLNTTLNEINLESNPISFCCAQELFLSAYSNPKLLHLRLLFQNLQSYPTFSWIVPCSRFKKESLITCSICEDYSRNHPESLDFSQCRLSSERAYRIFDWLFTSRNSLTIDTLNLYGNFDIGKQSVEQTAGVLEKMLSCISLKTLNLSSCGVEDTICKGIAAGLIENTGLENLYMDDNPTSVNAMNEVLLSANRNADLLCLSLFNTQLTLKFEGSERFWFVLNTKSEDFLHLCSQYSGRHIHIETFDFSQHGMTSCRVIEILHWIWNSRICVTVNTLDLSHNFDIGKGNVKETAEVLEKAISCSSLRKLNLSSCGIGDTLARGIAAGLIKNTMLTTLSIDDNPVSISAVKEVLQSACDNQNLMCLTFFGTQVTYEDSKQCLIVDCTSSEKFLELCSQYSGCIIHLETVNFSHCGMTSRRVIKILNYLCVCNRSLTVNTLDLSDNSNIGKSNVEEMAKVLKKILSGASPTTLNLRGCGIGDTIARGIAAGMVENTVLETLNIDDNPVSVSVMNEVFHSVIIKKTFVQLMFYETMATYLNQTWTIASTRNVWLFDVFRGVSAIQFQHLDFSKCKSSQIVESATKLLSLMSSCEVNIGTLDLSQNRSLNKDRNVQRAIIELVTIINSLKLLKFRNCGIDNTTAKKFVVELMRTSTLGGFDIENNLISIDAMMDVFLAANASKTVINLCLFDANVSRLSTGHNWTVKYSKSISKNNSSSLKIFELLSRYNFNVHELDVSGTKNWKVSVITDCIAKLLSLNCVEIVKADGVGRNVLVKLMQAFNLASPSCVKFASFDDNKFDHILSEALADMLRHNTSLTELSANSIDNVCARSIASALKGNRTLQVINGSHKAKFLATILVQY